MSHSRMRFLSPLSLLPAVRAGAFAALLLGLAPALTPAAHARGAEKALDWLANQAATLATEAVKAPSGAEKADKPYRPGALKADEALALYSPAQRADSFAACVDQFPGKRPLSVQTVPAQWKPRALCSDNFAVLYSDVSKTPLVVVERLNAQVMNDARDEQRTDKFYPDPRLPKHARAELTDFRSQTPAVDRGHLAAAANAPTAQAMAQTFALSNMVPQDPEHNQKVWSKVEGDVRKFARRAKGDVFVFTGPLFDAGYTTVGKNQVWKPTRMFKLVYDEASGRAWAYVQPNGPTRIEPPVDYVTFVKLTGWRLLDAHLVASN